MQHRDPCPKEHKNLIRTLDRQQWCTPLITVLGRLGQVDLECKASLVYRTSSRAARATQRNLFMKGVGGGRGASDPKLKIAGPQRNLLERKVYESENFRQCREDGKKQKDCQHLS